MNKQIIILGIPRSGTSMVAHICRLLGVFMGSEQPTIDQGNLGGTCEDVGAIADYIGIDSDLTDAAAWIRPELDHHITEAIS